MHLGSIFSFDFKFATATNKLKQKEYYIIYKKFSVRPKFLLIFVFLYNLLYILPKLLVQVHKHYILLKLNILYSVQVEPVVWPGIFRKVHGST